MKAVSLFAGVGGFDLALERAGVPVVASVEIDKHARGVLQQQFPNTAHLEDVQNVTGDQLRELGFNGSDGIIVGGFPCQDLSVAGKRAGLAGGRSGLFWEVCRIDGTFPRITIWENVPGALSSNNGDDFRTVLQTLDDIGALAQWWYVPDAQFFGVPQRRRRVFVISVFDPAIIERAGDGQILPVGESRRRNPAKGNKPREETATPIGLGIEQCGS